MSQGTSVQPRLADLLTRYLDRQAEAQALGAVAQPGEVTPYEAGPVQAVEPRLAWQEALVALRFYGVVPDLGAWPALPHWPALVAGHEPEVALPLALGNFPQMVRNFQQLWHRSDLAPPTAGAVVPITAPQLLDWADSAAAKRQFPQMLLAVGGLRLAKQFPAAEAYLRQHDREIPQTWRAGWENEKAALAWHIGESRRARQLWQTLEPTAPVLFNRGVADLFFGQPAPARAAFEAAAARLPESGGWQHLARLYVTLASMRGS